MPPQVKHAFPSWLARHYPGILIAAIGGICAEAISQHYGAPAMLIALLIGLAIHFVHDLDSAKPGIGFASRDVLRFGVALLGLKIAYSDIVSIGLAPLLLVAGAMAVTMVSAVFGARMLGLSHEFAALSGGSVAVCGASAAAAISSVLPQDKDSERSLAVVIAVVTVMATVAMIFYPLLIAALGLSPQDMGVILGGTIHDVAQVVAAGKAISPKVGELSILVKLMRVAMLLPIVKAVHFWLGRGAANQQSTGKVQLVPSFLVAFFAFAALNSLHLVSETMSTWGATASHYFLVVAITAIGIKTDLKSVLDVGWRPFALIVFETIIMLLVVLGGVLAMR
ncbi:MAG: putative sulfate exporter family transporter [Novosphingobium sp.]|uniref:YeiH family protein n=1 Tax=Novosphingobium sp. TaxID=1874826 RepID=UPI00262C2251|nr:putative sulfate exporter family transporter [Novosphingobium sp.]MCP5387876.1 putative sulfate exporter family transporter [Novosphingobium sp.]